MAETTQTKLYIEGKVAIIEMCRSPVNALGEVLRNEILAHIESCESNPNIHAIILASSTSIFSAGADISEFKTGFKGASLASIQSAFEKSKKLTVALINGKALGGAAEIAIACHYRVAEEQASIGFPEVTLGFIPGAGGTQRLPRLIPFKACLEMMLTGQSVSAVQAKELGLIDHVVTGELRQAGLAYVNKLIDEGISPRPTCDHAVKIMESGDIDWGQIALPWIDKTSRRVGPTAPSACFDALMQTTKVDFETGLKMEQDLFFKAILSKESQALQYAFFAQRRAAKQSEDEGSKDLRLIPKQIGVVGAGLMGGGIAMVMANAGLEVMLVDMNQENLDKGLEQIKSNYMVSVKHGRLTKKAVEHCLSLIKCTTDLTHLAEADLVVEAVFENMALKQDIFSRLSSICPRDTILATNTSALNLDEIASVVSDPDRVIGMHFFSPAQVTKLLEVVRGKYTSQSVIDVVLTLAKRIKKTSVVVGVCPGFVGNRMIFKYIKQANEMVLRGTMPQRVDQVIKDFGFPMGPFLMCDMIGLDLGWQIPEEPKDLRDVLCLAGRLGQKTKSGFYDYPNDIRVPEPSEEALKLIQSFAKSKDIASEELSDQEILERCLYALINEGFKILAEGIVSQPSDIDVIYLFGYGFPPYRGGPMYYAEQVGLEVVLEHLNAFHIRYGGFWEPAPLLSKMVQEGKRLKDWSSMVDCQL